MRSSAESGARQQTVAELASDGPTTGQPLDMDGVDRTHYGHVRYAATEEPGIIFYDPRDGREILVFDLPEGVREGLDVGERVVTSLKLYGHRDVCGIVDPEQSWAMEVRKARREEYETLELDAETDTRVVPCVSTQLFESQADARRAATERFDRYADAEWVDAVAYRLGGGDSG